ncbi:hypothetical protein [Brooklawnia cerclae]|uniref:Uncharacterized protein n=1 Tax=Brooklawnia cerclae TaxID=349934 RepID=A0ABX0SNC7_9ACTN|nr:hypothetical protein [Brooklawnia cerclae]NIH58545.1 hypothetical protein [Brooklawnia cerclae]
MDPREDVDPNGFVELGAGRVPPKDDESPADESREDGCDEYGFVREVGACAAGEPPDAESPDEEPAEGKPVAPNGLDEDE